ncbi:uncharacterized protein LOC663674 isoform X2 [Tribolium castaneum]|uniref:uncharacterized protein LOC663674 isoform X2 n=1 Tax=Tribolium castaneum TaxID=7070 RepID=UPI00046C28D7|nr:PREDICTED: uncharacterized protein LOC663674 isoform X2 [Tribolium castaneum]|eukprot:XP_008190613.1 PREDICTED: uncharacterized protein LOC663674 isoform X2 [Tribolium castaneum]
MTFEHEDILSEIPDDQLPQLANLYEEKAPWAPYMVSFIHMAMKWKKSGKYRNALKIFSPNNSWKTDGTIIARLILNVNQDITVFTLDDQCTNLYQGLTETSLLNYNNIRTIFYGVHERHAHVILKYLQEKKIKFVNIPCYFYCTSPEQAKKFTIECPSDVYLKKLEPSAGQQVDTIWPHRFLGSDQYLSNFIEANGGYGLFLKSTNEMVAWVLKHAWGHLAMLQTEEAHKRKGYASLVTKALSKEIAEEGHWPLGTILLENKNSISMFEKLGFSSIGVCNFFGMDTRDNK